MLKKTLLAQCVLLFAYSNCMQQLQTKTRQNARAELNRISSEHMPTCQPLCCPNRDCCTTPQALNALRIISAGTSACTAVALGVIIILNSGNLTTNQALQCGALATSSASLALTSISAHINMKTAILRRQLQDRSNQRAETSIT